MPGTEISISNIQNGVGQRSSATNADLCYPPDLQTTKSTISCTAEGFHVSVANPFPVSL